MLALARVLAASPPIARRQQGLTSFVRLGAAGFSASALQPDNATASARARPTQPEQLLVPPWSADPGLATKLLRLAARLPALRGGELNLGLACCATAETFAALVALADARPAIFFSPGGAGTGQPHREPMLQLDWSYQEQEVAPLGFSLENSAKALVAAVGRLAAVAGGSGGMKERAGLSLYNRDRDGWWQRVPAKAMAVPAAAAAAAAGEGARPAGGVRGPASSAAAIASRRYCVAPHGRELPDDEDQGRQAAHEGEPGGLRDGGVYELQRGHVRRDFHFIEKEEVKGAAVRRRRRGVQQLLWRPQQRQGARRARGGCLLPPPSRRRRAHSGRAGAGCRAFASTTFHPGPRCCFRLRA